MNKVTHLLQGCKLIASQTVVDNCTCTCFKTFDLYSIVAAKRNMTLFLWVFLPSFEGVCIYEHFVKPSKVALKIQTPVYGSTIHKTTH